MRKDGTQRARHPLRKLLPWLIPLLLLCAGGGWWYATRVPELEQTGSYTSDRLITDFSGYPAIDTDSVYVGKQKYILAVSWVDADSCTKQGKLVTGADYLNKDFLSPSGHAVAWVDDIGGERRRITVFRRDGRTLRYRPAIPFSRFSVHVNDAGYFWDDGADGHFFTPDGQPILELAARNIVPAVTVSTDPRLLPAWSPSNRLMFYLYDPVQKQIAFSHRFPKGTGIPLFVFTAEQRILTVNDTTACLFIDGRLQHTFTTTPGARWQVGSDGTVWRTVNKTQVSVVQWRRETPRLLSLPGGDGLTAVWGDGACHAVTSSLKPRNRQVTSLANRVLSWFGRSPLPADWRRVTMYRGEKACGRFTLPMDPATIDSFFSHYLAARRPTMQEAYEDKSLAFSKDGRCLVWYHQEGRERRLQTFQVPQ
ncbi:MAG: hypothetical protein ACYDCO_27575 [Armatimonadota bacterium]